MEGSTSSSNQYPVSDLKFGNGKPMQLCQYTSFEDVQPIEIDAFGICQQATRVVACQKTHSKLRYEGQHTGVVIFGGCTIWNNSVEY